MNIMEKVEDDTSQLEVINIFSKRNGQKETKKKEDTADWSNLIEISEYLESMISERGIPAIKKSIKYPS